jgi:hypothetical protein
MFIFLLVAVVSTASAEIFTWTDDQGTVHFAEDLGTVPKKFRTKVRTMGESEPPATEEPLATDAVQKPAAVTPQAAVNGKTLYDGKTFAAWQKDLADREAAMTALRKQIDELAARLNSSAEREERTRLRAEHKLLVEQFREQKAQYFQQVEKARNAGVKVDIQQ